MPAARLRLLTAELAIAAAAAAYSRLAGRASRRRASRQRTAELPSDVRLDAPLWLRLYLTTHLISLGGLVAALPAAFGWNAFSMGVFLTLAIAAHRRAAVFRWMTPAGLTFQEPGLRVHYTGVSVLVPWDDIQRIELAGPDHFTMLSVHITDLIRILASPSRGPSRIAAPGAPRLRP